MNKFTQKLTNLYTLTQMELAEHIIEMVADTGLYEPTTVTKGGLICLPKTPAPIILISHLDTVSKVQPTKEDITISNNIISLKPTAPATVLCLGGDDRNGVHLMLEVINQGITPTLLFPFDEEIGCVGTGNMIELLSEDLELFSRLQDNKLMVQIDRGVHGWKHKWEQEVVYYDESNKDFIQLMNCWFIEDTGSFTDVVEWTTFLGVAGCNIGAGYRNEHTRSEQTNITVLKEQLRKLLQVIEVASEDDTPFFEHVTPTPSPRGNYAPYGNYGNYDIYDDSDINLYHHEVSDWLLEMAYDRIWAQERYLRVPFEYLDSDLNELSYYEIFVEEYYGRML